MTANKFKKIIVYLLIFGQAALLPGLALAFVSTATGSLNPVPINDTGSTVGNTAFDAVLTPIRNTYTGCNAAIKTFEATDNAAQLGFSFSSLVGGGGALATQLAAEITAYNTYLNPPCLGALVPALDAVTAPNTYTSTLKQQMLTQLKADTQTYQAKLKVAQGRYNVASQSIWKALLITVLINTSKSVADQLVTKLVNNYKIANIKGYVDSLATLSYDNQFIRDNFPNNQDQLMARAVLTNPLFRSQIQPITIAKTNQNLGFDPTTLATNDPNYYAKMASVGMANNNPYYVQTVFVDAVDASHANALSHAQLQVSQGSGYKAPVNCAGSLAQQQSIDQQTKALNDQLNNRQALLSNLQQAQALGKNVAPSDLAKAQSDYNAALAAWNKLPYTVAGANSGTGSNSLSANLTSGTNTEGAAAIVMCEAISSPAVLVNQGIDAMFKSVGGNLSQYNNSNLPGFLSAISSIATQIGSSMVLGGITGKSATVNENQAIGQSVTAVTGAAIQSINNSAIANAGSGINFASNPVPGSPGSYSLSWQVVAAQVPTVSYVTISGTGAPAGKLPLSGSVVISPTSYSNYVLNANNAAGQSLGVATTYISPPSLSLNSNSNSPAVALSTGLRATLSGAERVAGAFISVLPLNTRGPATVPLHPRGE